ncbi:hypothetical protein EVAR_33123_1 [Eumeta japonica]|uniref:Uncharacterized protein n=1 Tax=Eumeta variegata TaxID=151549 RepID=A0A4C1Y898_EUMVA|nr:hypothetical protein EVAR_33123_1 [Eumeta japonica]
MVGNRPRPALDRRGRLKAPDSTLNTSGLSNEFSTQIKLNQLLISRNASSAAFKADDLDCFKKTLQFKIATAYQLSECAAITESTI